MRKLGLLILVAMMLFGCSQGGINSTFMITRDNQLYALYNQDGDKLTNYLYKTFEEIQGVGYIVTNEKDQKGFINIDGDEVIPFGTYETLEAVDEMLYATKKVEQKEEQKETVPQTDTYNNNLFVLNGDGEVLYTASQETQIRKSKLPIIIENNKYTILYKDGEVLLETKDEVLSANQYENSTCVVVNYQDHSEFYDFTTSEEAQITDIKEKGNFEIIAKDKVLNKSVILYDKTLKSLLSIDEENKTVYQNTIAVDSVEYDNLNNIILKQGQKVYIYEMGKEPVLMTSYYKDANHYLIRSQVIYGPHQVYADGKVIGELENCQLYPASYHISGSIFPVYEKDKGFVFYGFDNKQAFDDVYLKKQGDICQMA